MLSTASSHCCNFAIPLAVRITKIGLAMRGLKCIIVNFACVDAVWSCLFIFFTARAMLALQALY